MYKYFRFNAGIFDRRKCTRGLVSALKVNCVSSYSCSHLIAHSNTNLLILNRQLDERILHFCMSVVFLNLNWLYNCELFTLFQVERTQRIRTGNSIKADGLIPFQYAAKCIIFNINWYLKTWDYQLNKQMSILCDVCTYYLNKINIRENCNESFAQMIRIVVLKNDNLTDISPSKFLKWKSIKLIISQTMQSCSCILKTLMNF